VDFLFDVVTNDLNYLHLPKTASGRFIGTAGLATAGHEPMATDQRDISHRLDSIFLVDPSQPGDPPAVAPPGPCIEFGLQLCLKTATLPASIDHHQASSIPPTTL